MQMVVDYTQAQHEILWEQDHMRTRVVPKGRRAGMTHGAVKYGIEKLWTERGKSALWGDTIAGNIDRYWSRYFEPELIKQNIPYKWHSTNRELIIGNRFTRSSLIDFRSADRPENWEGFGYDLIMLNEAGIILKDRDLFESSVVPMMFDAGADARLIAFGVPKMVGMKNPTEYIYHHLWLRAQQNVNGYWSRTITAQDNPFIDWSIVVEEAEHLSSAMFRQEIMGEFVTDGASGIQSSMVKTFTDIPDGLEIFTGVDLAISIKDKADYTAIVTIGIDRKKERETYGHIFWLDVVCARLGFNGTAQAIVDSAKKWKPFRIMIESNGFQQVMADKLLQESELPIAKYDPSKEKQGDKWQRFQPVLARYEAGMMHHRIGLDREAITQVYGFPNPKIHDDVPDALSIAYYASRKYGKHHEQKEEAESRNNKSIISWY